jgi:hypothetical protein
MRRFFHGLLEVIVVASMLVVALVWTCSALLTLLYLFVAHRFREADSIAADARVAVPSAPPIGRYRS